MISKFFIERPVLANVLAIVFVLIGAVAFWGSRFAIQLVVFNRHARDSVRWCALSSAGTLLWLYLTAFVVLLGAELNGEAERQAGRDR